MKVSERKLQQIGGTLFLSMPKGWIDSLHLKKGSVLRITTNENGAITIHPDIIKDENKKESVIQFDEAFVRRFFKEYFSGYEQIIVKFPKNSNSDERKKAYAFLKKFINVQIIEDTAEKLVLKAFRVEELSIEDCLKRMFFLTLNMIDELAGDNDKEKLKELETNVKRFYYMLVMQIRRFIGEGKFAEQNQISLLRAVDCRMVGLKLDDTSEMILVSEQIKNKEIMKLLEDARKTYNDAFMIFLNKNYEKALIHWSEEKRLREKHKKLIDSLKTKQSTTEYQQIKDCLEIIRIARTISMLAR